MIEEMEGRKFCWTIENEKWERKEYIKESNGGTIKYIKSRSDCIYGSWKLTTKRKAWTKDAQCVN